MDEYVVGQFHRCSIPSGGLVHAVVNKLWGRSCKIGCKKLGHLPVWVNLKNIPDCCYSRLGISHITSGLGEPMLTHKPRLDPTSMGEVKILVEVELDKAFPKMIALNDKQGNIFLVEVEYTWIPSMCAKCLLPPNTASTINNKNSLKVSDEILVVDIDQVVNEHSQSFLEKQNQVLQGSYSDELNPTQTKNLQPIFATPTKEACTNFGSNQSKKTQDNPVGILPIVSQTITQEVTLFAASNSCNSFSPLAGEKSAPLQSLTMEEVPSNIIVSDSLQASSDDHLICSPNAKTPENQHPDHNTMSYDHPTVFVANGDSSTSFSLTRGGRSIKPTQKFQDMEWHTVGGRGKRDRGRGNRPPN
ncbi:hypothetical protein N665_0751s0003 [Sinapis alba]|nr:hypothetical protein N665_0751s0003 [Sinapis alba]